MRYWCYMSISFFFVHMRRIVFSRDLSENAHMWCLYIVYIYSNYILLEHHATTLWYLVLCQLCQ